MIQPTKIIARSFSWFRNIPLLPILIDEQLKIYTLLFRPAIFKKMILLTSWLKSLPNVKTKYHTYGGMEFGLGDREICHIHGDGLVDIVLNKTLKAKYLTLADAEPHHILPGSNMVSVQIRSSTDMYTVKSLIRDAYSAIDKKRRLTLKS